MDVRAEIGRFGLRLQKSLGQNFLHDETVAERLIENAHLDSSDVGLEVGPGLGFLTGLLVEKAGLVHAVEKDRRLASILREKFEGNKRLNIIQGDFLKVSIPRFSKVVSTPPYLISSRLILFLSKRNFETAVLALQKEFAERLSAKVGSSSYGRLSITAQESMRVEMLDFIPRTSFYPQPGVDSRIVKLTPLPRPGRRWRPLFEELVREAFTQRRRLLRGALRHYLRRAYGSEGAVILQKLSVPEKRVFQTTGSEFENLAKELLPLVKPEQQA